MGNTTVTVKGLDSLSATQRRGIDRATRDVMALEPNDAAIARAVKGVMTLKGYGFSGRGVAAILAVSSDGATSSATVARLVIVGDAVADATAWPESMGDAGTAITGALYRVACKVKSADVASIVKRAQGAATADDAYGVLTEAYADIRANLKRAALTPPKRNTANAVSPSALRLKPCV